MKSSKTLFAYNRIKIRSSNPSSSPFPKGNLSKKNRNIFCNVFLECGAIFNFIFGSRNGFCWYIWYSKQQFTGSKQDFCWESLKFEAKFCTFVCNSKYNFYYTLQSVLRIMLWWESFFGQLQWKTRTFPWNVLDSKQARAENLCLFCFYSQP